MMRRLQSLRGAALMTPLLLAGLTAPSAFAQTATMDLTPPETAAAGSTIAVKWSGPMRIHGYIPEWAIRVAIAASTHAWTVVPYWETPDGRMSDVSSGARVTVNVQ
jgi:hypothetical protein